MTAEKDNFLQKSQSGDQIMLSWTVQGQLSLNTHCGFLHNTHVALHARKVQ